MCNRNESTHACVSQCIEALHSECRQSKRDFPFLWQLVGNGGHSESRGAHDHVAKMLFRS